MAPSGRSGAAKARSGASTKSKATPSSSLEPPKPYRRIPDSLEPFVSALSPNHIYITHIDSQPVPAKRNIFLVPVAINLAVVLLFVWRVTYIGPYYLNLLGSALGHVTATSVNPGQMAWSQLAWLVLGRGFSLTLDLALVVFVWPWPVEFCLGRSHSNPVAWRWSVGFREQEVYVRRSREWDRPLSSAGGGILQSAESRSLLMHHVRPATDMEVLRQKSGYVTMNGDWDLDWAAMVHAHALVDKKEIAMDAFRLVVFVHSDEHGWMVMDTSSTSPKSGGEKVEEERRRQVFAFRDALAALGKEELFFRWIEIVQYETTQPGGFTAEKQVAVAQQIRDLFQERGVDFDELWKESVGTESMAGFSA